MLCDYNFEQGAIVQIWPSVTFTGILVFKKPVISVLKD